VANPPTRFHGPQRRFELALDGKPDLDGWIGVHVTIDGPDGSWSAASRSLRVNDVTRLITWFEAAATDPTLEGRLETLDNELWFELFGNEPRLLRIHFGPRLRPARAPSLRAGDLCHDYPVTCQSLESAANTLREALRQVTQMDRA
jgi:hypothetical protein